ncbi:MAG: extracellular solute-binding protein [Phycisphaerales bacterium]
MLVSALKPSRVTARCRTPAVVFLLAAWALALGSCDSKAPRQAGASEPAPAPPPPPTLVLYSSADDHLVKLVVEQFEKDSGIKVEWTGDTEQTKTTGLVQRLIAEKDAPQADAWWSSEPMGTIRLAREGLLAPYKSKVAEASMTGGWPGNLRGSDGTWYGFAPRVRVIVYNSLKVRKEDRPRTVEDLTKPVFRGRVGMARPQFGTTGAHMAALSLVYGEDAFSAWLEAMNTNRVKLFDGNAAVVRAVGTGELLVGLTDTDDVWAGQANNWPVDLIYEPNDFASSPLASFKGFGKVESLALGAGPLLLPNTVALVKGALHPDAAKRFIDFLLSERIEGLLLASESHNLPLRERLLRDSRFQTYTLPLRTLQPMNVDFERAADLMEPTLKLCDEKLGTR